MKDTLGRGGFDYAGLLDKADQILEDAREEAEKMDDDFDAYTEFDDKEFQRASVTAFRKVLEAAPEQDRATPGYQKLLEETDKRTVQLESMQKAEEALDRQMALLAREKTGLFVNMENSAEYDTMMAGLTTAKNKMRMLKGDTAGISAEKLETVLNNDTLQEGMSLIKKDAAFRKMVSSLTRDQLADKVIDGPDAVLTAYLDATKALNADAIGKSGSEMTQEERQEFMRNATFGQNRDPGGIEA